MNDTKPYLHISFPNSFVLHMDHIGIANLRKTTCTKNFIHGFIMVIPGFKMRKDVIFGYSHITLLFIAFITTL